MRAIAAGAIEVRDLSELNRLAEAMSTVSHGGFKNLDAIDAAASRLRRMPNREASVERLMRVRKYCSDHSILPERAPRRTARTAADGPGSARDAHARSHVEDASTSRDVTRKAGRDRRDTR